MKKFNIWVLTTVLFAIAFIAALVFLQVPAKGPTFVDSKPRLAIESAFGAELKLLLDKTTNKTEYVLNGKKFTTGSLNGVDVVLNLSGISMVNAAAYTQLLLDNFNVRDLIFSGIAGGVNPALSIGDVVVPAQWGEYQEMTYAREVDGNYVLPFGGKAEFPNYGMMFPGSTSVTRKGAEADKSEEKFWFPVDAKLLGYAQAISPDILVKCTPEKVCLDKQPVLKIGGNGVDGMTFVDNAAFRDYVWATFQADCLAMETAAVAHVAYSNNIPFLGFRSLSDLAGGGDGQNQIKTFFQLAANNSANVVLSFVDHYKAGLGK